MSQSPDNPLDLDDDELSYLDVLEFLEGESVDVCTEEPYTPLDFNDDNNGF